MVVCIPRNLGLHKMFRWNSSNHKEWKIRCDRVDLDVWNSNRVIVAYNEERTLRDDRTGRGFERFCVSATSLEEPSKKSDGVGRTIVTHLLRPQYYILAS
jgi:hypothetical protein